MSDKKNIIIAVLVFILFFLLFPLNLGSNLSYHSNESKNLLRDDLAIPENKIPYVYKDRAGYYSTDLKHSWSIDIDDGITLLTDGYINYSRKQDTMTFKDYNGNEKYSIQENGFPFSISERFFIISRDRKSLSEIVNGEVKWNKVFNYIITTISGNIDTLSIGFMNGSFVLYDADGEVLYDYEPGGSRVSIIYRCALSSNSQYLAIISGLDPQRFILYEKKDVDYRPIYTLNLKDEVRKSLNIFITSDNKRIFIEGVSGFYVVDIEGESSTFIEDNYKLKNVEYLPELDVYMVHSGAVNYNNVKLITLDNRVLMEKYFIGEDVSVSTLNNSLYFVIDNAVLKLDIVE